MAEAPKVQVVFGEGCPDCGRRQVTNLPRKLPDVGDDFDWLVRDYDGFRLLMMEELAARMPERRRFTPADLEVVLVEVLAAALDQLSDMADRIAGEKTLATARRPESIRRLLRFIGYDAMRIAYADGLIDMDPAQFPMDAASALERLWVESPFLMEAARLEGPRRVHTQRRMVTVQDHATLIEQYPLVLRTKAFAVWGGGWSIVRVAVLCFGGGRLDWKLKTASTTEKDTLVVPKKVEARVNAFHRLHELSSPDWNGAPTIRSLLAEVVEAYRMAGQEVQLLDVSPVGIWISFAVRISDACFQSEVRSAIEQALGPRPGGFFEPGKLRIGEDLHASDIVQKITSIDGVEHVCLHDFKRVGHRDDQVTSGVVTIDDFEVAVCDNDPVRPGRGYLTIALHGGRRG